MLRSNPSSDSSHSQDKARYNLAAISPAVMQEYSRVGYNKEADDRLHSVGAPVKRSGWARNIGEGSGSSGTIFTTRGLLELSAVGVLGCALLMLFGGKKTFQLLISGLDVFFPHTQAGQY